MHVGHMLILGLNKKEMAVVLQDIHGREHVQQEGLEECTSSTLVVPRSGSGLYRAAKSKSKPVHRLARLYIWTLHRALQ